MPAFTERFNDLSSWTIGSVFSSDITIASTGPSWNGSPYAKMASANASPWGIARYDPVSGGVAATTYWMAYAFYLPNWSDVWASSSQTLDLPGIPGCNPTDPTALTTGTNLVVYPYLNATSSSTGKINNGSGGAGGTNNFDVTAGVWHTLRLGVKINGASSLLTFYLDNVLLNNAIVENFSSSAGCNTGGWGAAWIDFGGDDSAEVRVDQLTWSPGSDPGEPSSAPDPSTGALPSAYVRGCGEGQTVRVWIDNTEVTRYCTRGSWTRRLNRPSTATVTIPMDKAIGDAGSKLLIERINGTFATIVFHGTILNTETDTDKDQGTTIYNASDPMELWQWRPVRDDGADFSKPDVILQYKSAPQILQAMLINSVDSTGRMNSHGKLGGPPPTKAEGALMLQLGSFAVGGVDISGAPVDWPQTIAELFTLMVTTGQIDAIITPIDGGTSGNLGILDVYNGNYGTDRSGSVKFSYGMNAHNVETVRWNRDMTNMVNKYWLYGGPQIQTASDPAGDQHWCFNVTGDDTGLPGFGMPGTPPYSNVIARRSASQTAHGVRMKIDIFDAYDNDCIPNFGTPGHQLYRYQWIIYSYLAAVPRELIHIIPVRDSMVGCFDIGDLVHVEATAAVRGGFSGSQRVYGYTTAWETTNAGPVLSLDELQTSADNEGAF
jgi:hypothetical protein